MLIFTLANERQRRQIEHQEGPVEFGRLQQGQCARIVVDDPFTSRDQLRVEELADGDVRIQNLGSPISLSDGSQLATGEARQVTPPLKLMFGRTMLDIGGIPDDSGSMHSLARPLAGGAKRPSAVAQGGRVPSAETLAQWFETLLTVQRAAAGSTEFYAETARAVVELVGLNRGLVLLRRGEAWEVIAGHSSAGDDNRQFSRRVLNQVVTEQRTYYQSFQDNRLAQSLMGIEAVVASPIFDEYDAVVGVVYGSRDMRTAVEGQRGIDALEAQFVQLLAGAVSAGLARLAREADAARARVQFEQFFSPELARALERDSGILAAQERDLSLLFTDLRGFSRISERIGPGETFHLLADILDRLTDHIMDHGGVVIDYYGDGLAAMWNAPTDTPNHPDRAVAAALAMQGALPEINCQWAEKIGGLVRLGIGLHKGIAQIGNSGSQRRLKYGPRGHAVNLTSRVEAATKIFGVPCLMTGEMRAALTQTVPVRRLCRARLTGMAEPVELFELAALKPHPTWPQQRQRYEEALRLFEQNHAAECLDACRAMQEEFGAGDGPTAWLCGQAKKRLAAIDEPFDAVFGVETK
jgi:adenylate cyclase